MQPKQSMPDDPMAKEVARRADDKNPIKQGSTPAVKIKGHTVESVVPKLPKG